MVLANFQNENQVIELPNLNTKILINNCSEMNQEENKITLQGYQVIILEVI